MLCSYETLCNEDKLMNEVLGCWSHYKECDNWCTKNYLLESESWSIKRFKTVVFEILVIYQNEFLNNLLSL